MTKRSVGAVSAIVLAAAIQLGSPISGVDPLGKSALSVIAFAAVLWAFDVLPAGITAVVALGLLVAAGVPSAIALSGYATGAFWILVCVLFFGTAMERTGLARRIAYGILRFFHPTYLGVLVAFFAIGFVLTLGIPSMTVRTAIMVPIAFAVVKAVDLPLPSTGSALILLTTFEMAVLPGNAILTGSLWGPFVAGLFATAGQPITWLDYAKVMALPTITWCGLIVVANVIALRPEKALGMDRDIVRTEVEALGPMGRAELVTAAIVVVSVLGWITQPWHHVPPEAIGMLALGAFFAGGVLGPADIGTGIPWGLAIFVGSMLSLTSVMTTYKINGWLGSYVVPTVEALTGGPFGFAVAIAVGVATMRFIDPVGFITIAAFFLPLVGFMTGRGVPALVLVGIILLPVHVFWFNYQNFWVVMTEGLSQGSAFTDSHRFRLATVFFGVTVVALGLAVVYWRLAGLLP